jgi:hypothetical protein
MTDVFGNRSCGLEKCFFPRSYVIESVVEIFTSSFEGRFTSRLIASITASILIAGALLSIGGRGPCVIDLVLLKYTGVVLYNKC